MAERVVRRKKKPKQLAVVDQAGCTGCEACIQVCPVDCIHVVPGENGYPGHFQLVEIDLDTCIGCTLCAQYCPWDTIHMLPYDEAFRIAPEWTIRSVLQPAWLTSSGVAVSESESPAASSAAPVSSAG